ncbi:MAG: DUF1653 domain-containing protein [bacterium]
MNESNTKPIQEDNVVVPGQRYKHFKGNEYIVKDIARNCDNPEELFVVYQGQYDSPEYSSKPLWIRKLSDFTGEKVFDDGREPVKRFTLINKNDKH